MFSNNFSCCNIPEGYSSRMDYNCFPCRLEERGDHMSHVKTSAHNRTLRDIQLRGVTLHGL